MQALSLEELDAQALRFDRGVCTTPDIDSFCSSSLWGLPASHALMPPRTPWIYRGEDGWIAMMHGRHAEGWRYVEPLEAMWGLACPLIGHDPVAMARQLAALGRERAADWDVMLLSGLPMGSQLLAEVTQRMLARYEIFPGQSTTRHVASLAGGVDGFLARRTRNFRKSLRQALRSAEAEGICFESLTATEPAAALALYQRIMAIETRSWKGRAGVGVDAGSMHGFYRDMIQRMAPRGALRLVVARRADMDIAYVLGGVLGDTYRGLQFSFDAELSRLSLGNLCQYRQIVELCAEGIMYYDLGTGMEYKRRWAEITRDSVTLITVKRPIR